MIKQGVTLDDRERKIIRSSIFMMQGIAGDAVEQRAKHKIAIYLEKAN